MDLIVTDSKRRASQFADALGATPRRGFYEGDEVLVGWWSGRPFHLVSPEDYAARFAHWRREDLPIVPADFRLITTAQGRQELALLEALLARYEVRRIIVAVEPSEDAAYQAREVLTHLAADASKRTERFVSSRPLTREAIEAGMKSLVPLDQWERAGEIGAIRDRAGWLVGHNLSRLVNLATGEQSSFGRITTPVLRMIADSLTASERPPGARGRHLPNLTDLQVAAGRSHGLSARATLAIAERLYEVHHAITYPATTAHRVDQRDAGLLHTVFANLPRSAGRIYGNFDEYLLESLCRSADDVFVGGTAVLPLHPFARAAAADERAVYRLVVEGFRRAIRSPWAVEGHLGRGGHDCTSEADILEVLERFGVGTAAERTFLVDRLAQRGACTRDADSVNVTDYGKRTVEAIERIGSLNWFTDLQSLGAWERTLLGDPAAAYAEVVRRLEEACACPAGLQAPRNNGARRMLALTCPICGGSLREGKRFYYCRNARTACRFFLPKEKAGHVLSEEDLRALTRPGRSFTPRAQFHIAHGGTVRGRLFYDYVSRRVRIDYLGPRYSHIPRIRPSRRTMHRGDEP